MSFEIQCEDSLDWMPKHQKEFSSVITSLPDMDEMNFSKKKKKYITFFRDAVSKVLNLVKDEGYCIFIQTDRKCNGYIDKSYYIMDEAFKLNFECITHKIILKQPVGISNTNKPTYSHLLIFTKKGNKRVTFPDVFYEGDILYKNGTSTTAIQHCIDFLKHYLIKDICDPFVGQGTVLKLAKENLFEKGVGIDCMEEQCEIAKKNLSI
jgi:hypothetical protein